MIKHVVWLFLLFPYPLIGQALEDGDKVWLSLTRTSGSGDFTITTSSFYVQQLYRE